jgi:RNA polymerase sigma-70 factor (ECF subfamily)
MIVQELRPTEQDLGAGPRTGRFRRRTTLVDSEEQRRLVSRAVARAKAGDSEATRFLYIRYADNVYGYVRSIVRDEHESEDVTQHVFAKLLTVIVKYEERSVPFSAWILRVARNVAVDHMRRSRAMPCEEVRGLDEADEGGGSDRLRTLSDALGELPEEQRRILMLRHLVGLTPGEIADELGRSEASIHGLHHRGRRALQRELADVGLAPATAA